MNPSNLCVIQLQVLDDEGQQLIDWFTSKLHNFYRFVWYLNTSFCNNRFKTISITQIKKPNYITVHVECE